MLTGCHFSSFGGSVEQRLSVSCQNRSQIRRISPLCRMMVFLAVEQASGENFTAPARHRMSESNPIIDLLLLSTKKNLILPFCSTTENDFLCAPSSYKMSEHILIRQILHHNFFVSLSQIVK